MTFRETLERLQEIHKRTHLLTYLAVMFGVYGRADNLVTQDDAEEFFEACFQELILFYKDGRLRGLSQAESLEDFDEVSFTGEINRTLIIIRDYLNLEFQLSLEEKEIPKPRVH